MRDGNRLVLRVKGGQVGLRSEQPVESKACIIRSCFQEALGRAARGRRVRRAKPSRRPLEMHFKSANISTRAFIALSLGGSGLSWRGQHGEHGARGVALTQPQP